MEEGEEEEDEEEEEETILGGLDVFLTFLVLGLSFSDV